MQKIIIIILGFHNNSARSLPSPTRLRAVIGWTTESFEGSHSLVASSRLNKEGVIDCFDVLRHFVIPRPRPQARATKRD